ncbi:class II glutamine amidotransferase [Fervidobacterium sp.]
MCRMSAFSSSNDICVDEVFNKVSVMAEHGRGAPHDDGYGLIVLSEFEKIEYKSTKPIYEDNNFKMLCEKLRGEIGIIHARKASPGIPVGLHQLHPFYIEGRYLAHNGTIMDANKANLFQSDTYDFFLSIHDFKDFEGLLNNVRKYVEAHDFSGLNFLLLDELDKSLYVGCIYTGDSKYFTLYYKADKAGFFVYSQEDVDDSLAPMENGQIFKVRNGEIVEEGKVF